MISETNAALRISAEYEVPQGVAEAVCLSALGSLSLLRIKEQGGSREDITSIEHVTGSAVILLLKELGISQAKCESLFEAALADIERECRGGKS